MEALGINPVLLIAQLISFSVLVLVLNRFLYKKIRESLEQRREAVKHALDHEKETEKRIKALEEERLGMLKQNQAAVKTLLAEAKKEAEGTKKEILAEAEVKAKKLVEGAKTQIDLEKNKAQDELRSEALKLAKKMAEKIMVDDSLWQLKQM